MITFAIYASFGIADCRLQIADCRRSCHYNRAVNRTTSGGGRSAQSAIYNLQSAMV
ncbi:hypothetical protein K2Z83_06990 [Oscillochloris sp. ZM17-4]|uniref:hypothetical protein n=1 Tax=Oscillochloris sp. ZM17-4 TaxID=2866714 RepID=UPI001C731AD9|nr:hypothetical protein [Oscillochloris sp. ZM17-4]MBX0327421.1 hypothetical protein [Oscillochloris sp. ZM17-4]